MKLSFWLISIFMILLGVYIYYDNSKEYIEEKGLYSFQIRILIGVLNLKTLLVMLVFSYFLFIDFINTTSITNIPKFLYLHLFLKISGINFLMIIYVLLLFLFQIKLGKNELKEDFDLLGFILKTMIRYLFVLLIFVLIVF